MSAITAYCPKRKRIKIVIKLFKRSGSLRRSLLREIPLNFAPASRTTLTLSGFLGFKMQMMWYEICDI